MQVYITLPKAHQNPASAPKMKAYTTGQPLEVQMTEECTTTYKFIHYEVTYLVSRHIYAHSPSCISLLIQSDTILQKAKYFIRQHFISAQNALFRHSTLPCTSIFFMLFSDPTRHY